MKRIVYFLVLTIALCACEPTSISIRDAGSVDIISVNKAGIDYITEQDGCGIE